MRTAWRLIDAQTGEPIVDSLQLADCFWSRLLGWQFRRNPGPGWGLLLVPCSSIHTCFLRFALDLAMLDSEGTVLAIRQGVRPWRAVVAPPKTHAVLEIPAPGHGLGIGQSLAVRPAATAEAVRVALPKSLQFLDKP